MKRWKYFWMLVPMVLGGIIWAAQSHKSVPTLEIEANSTHLTFDQGLLYYQGQRYSGYVVEHDQQGHLVARAGYLNGNAEGESLRWYANGRIAEHRLYRENRKTGTHEGWWENGQQRFVYEFDADKPVGTHREWYANGQLFTLMEYNADGQPEGRQQLWFDNGKIKANYVVKAGRRFGLLGSKGCMGKNEVEGTPLATKQ
ncbi:MAG: hypothetical protein U0Y10_21580 [Spirosomataceae bacterium]